MHAVCLNLFFQISAVLESFLFNIKEITPYLHDTHSDFKKFV